MELIHTYSLIHDDLPCMDDDDLRRGRPTSHKVYGEATAILTGDALLTLAFELLARNALVPGVKPSAVIEVTRRIASAAGTLGMVGGQMVDIYSEGKKVTAGELKYIHTHKTGALIKVSLETGAILAGATDRTITALGRYGEALGLLFQTVDDILNITGDAARLGKAVGSDRERGKATYPALFGLEESRRRARRLALQAKACLRPLGQKRSNALADLADFVLERDR
jgi:geranylgeranyl diphosphate synthase type II